MPTVERKIRVISNWFWTIFLGRDTTRLADLQTPYRQFREAASPQPRPQAAAAPKPATDAKGTGSEKELASTGR